MHWRAGCMAMGLAACVLATSAWAREIIIDDVNSYARFQLRLPLGREMHGRFPRMQAEWQPQTDGRWRVLVSLPADAAEIPGSPRYTRIMRSEMFFDSHRHPQIQFLSDPFDAGMLARGGILAGVLSMRGVVGRENLQLAPSTCLPPVPHDCQIDAIGVVSRKRYGMRSLTGVVGDEVRFRLRTTHGSAP